MGDQPTWYALFREPDETELLERPVTDMVVAWLGETDCDAELDRYLMWDRQASPHCASWRLVEFGRRPRASYFRTHKDADDLIDYHFVLEDWNEARTQAAVKVHGSWSRSNSES
jgi:hypothetical protein